MSRKNGNSMLAMILVLTSVGILSGLILGWVHSLTEGPVEEAARRARIEAISQVLPPFDNDPSASVVDISVSGQPKPFRVYPATEGGRFVGAAVESYSMDGFSGEIDIIYGFDAEGAVVDYHVMHHAETPGLGAKMEQWFRMPEGHRSVIGLNPATARVAVTKDGGDVDAITAATITSRAFLGALREAHEAFEIYKKQQNS